MPKALTVDQVADRWDVSANTVRFLTIDEVADLFRVSKRTMQDFAIEHRFLRKLGRRGLVEADQIPALYRVWRNTKRPAVEELEEQRLTADDAARRWYLGIDIIAAGEAETGWVYFFKCGDRVKIGFSADWQRRFKEIQTASPDKLEVVRVQRGNEAAEARLHEQFRALRVHLEWFRYEGALKSFLEAKGCRQNECA